MELPDDSDDASLDSLSLPDSPLPSDTVPVPDSLLSDVAPESSSSSSSSSPPDDALKVPDSADDAEASSSSSPLADALADDADADDALADSDSLAELAELADSDSDSDSEALDMDDSVSSSEVSDLQEFLFLAFRGCVGRTSCKIVEVVCGCGGKDAVDEPACALQRARDDGRRGP